MYLLQMDSNNFYINIKKFNKSIVPMMLNMFIRHILQLCKNGTTSKQITHYALVLHYKFNQETRVLEAIFCGVNLVL